MKYFQKFSPECPFKMFYTAISWITCSRWIKSSFFLKHLAFEVIHVVTENIWFLFFFNSSNFDVGLTLAFKIGVTSLKFNY